MKRTMSLPRTSAKAHFVDNPFACHAWRSTTGAAAVEATCAVITTPSSLAFSGVAGIETSKPELLSFAASSLVSEDPALLILTGEAAPELL